MSDERLLQQFIASFGTFEKLLAVDPVPPELDGGIDDGCGLSLWKPAAISTDIRALDEFYARIPGPLPTLFEQLILNYRWLEVDLDYDIRLLANPPGADLSGLAKNMAADPVLTSVLFPLGLVPFGRAGNCYDPLCFDLQTRFGHTDCRILRIEHESVLCHERVGQTWTIERSFHSMVNRLAQRVP